MKKIFITFIGLLFITSCGNSNITETKEENVVNNTYVSGATTSVESENVSTEVKTPDNVSIVSDELEAMELK